MRGKWPGPICEILDEPFDDQHLKDLRSKIRDRRASLDRKPGSRRIVYAAVAAVPVAFLLFVLLFALNSRQSDQPLGPIRLANGTPLATVEIPTQSRNTQRLDFDEGSNVELVPGSTLLPIKNTPSSLVLTLESGRGTFEVTPNTGRRWIIDAGHATVIVVGTLFTVSRDASSVTVGVARGEVLVRSDHLEGGRQTLAMGQSVEIRLPDDELPEETFAERHDEVEPETTPDPIQEHPPPTRRTAPISWQDLARSGEYRRAYESLGNGGVHRLTRNADTIAELLTLADVARRSGHPREAVEPLERAIAEFSGDRRAAIAAFTLGRIEADSLRRNDRAASAFRRCLELGPPRALREDVYGRLAETYARAGRYDELRAISREYIRQFPQGRRAEQLRRWADQP